MGALNRDRYSSLLYSIHGYTYIHGYAKSMELVQDDVQNSPDYLGSRTYNVATHLLECIESKFE